MVNNDFGFFILSLLPPGHSRVDITIFAAASKQLLVSCCPRQVELGLVLLLLEILLPYQLNFLIHIDHNLYNILW